MGAICAWFVVMFILCAGSKDGGVFVFCCVIIVVGYFGFMIWGENFDWKSYSVWRYKRNHERNKYDNCKFYKIDIKEASVGDYLCLISKIDKKAYYAKIVCIKNVNGYLHFSEEVDVDGPWKEEGNHIDNFALYVDHYARKEDSSIVC